MLIKKEFIRSRVCIPCFSREIYNAHLFILYYFRLMRSVLPSMSCLCEMR